MIATVLRGACLNIIYTSNRIWGYLSDNVFPL